MTLREWIPQWLEAYKLGTIKERSYHQLELLVKHFPDTLLDTDLFPSVVDTSRKS